MRDDAREKSIGELASHRRARRSAKVAPPRARLNRKRDVSLAEQVLTIIRDALADPSVCHVCTCVRDRFH